ncbi:hypothetical protein [Lonepinella sp. BR2474]|uniref:hypothetical protein n=1 Tax=Lonepinella sp. BR2474 TaxID=3434548 RepID=UPI003F6E3F4B
MKSLNTTYFERIDHLRFFAAVLVIFHHLRGNLPKDNLQFFIDGNNNFATMATQWLHGRKFIYFSYRFFVLYY